MLELIFQDFIRLFQENPLGQSFGFGATFILLYGYFQTDDKMSKLIILISVFFWFFHFLFLELYIPMLTSMIALVKIGLSIKYEKNLGLCAMTICITLIIGIITFQGLYHSLPVITSIIGTINFFFFHGALFRVAHIFNSGLWIIYSLIFGSIGGFINHTLTIFVLSITLVRILSHDGYFEKYKIQVQKIIHNKRHIDGSELVLNNRGYSLIKKKGYIHILIKRFKNKSLIYK